jgi:hypothetical protein
VNDGSPRWKSPSSFFISSSRKKQLLCAMSVHQIDAAVKNRKRTLKAETDQRQKIGKHYLTGILIAPSTASCL